MNLQKCRQGHFYDADKYTSCPHCEQKNEVNDPVTIAHSTSDNQVTMANPTGGAGTANISLQDAIAFVESGSSLPEDDNKTISFYQTAAGVKPGADPGIDPVVGWLVCVEGNYFGQSFNLKSGRNFIGRSSGMNVVLDGDSSVSRDRHAVVVYDPKSRIFIAQPGDSRELFYLQKDVVLTNAEIKPYDVLSIGNTKLMFVPCCTKSFAWENLLKKE